MDKTGAAGQCDQGSAGGAAGAGVDHRLQMRRAINQ